MTWCNDNDPKVCAWLSRLVQAGTLPQMDVHCAPIQTIDPKEIIGHDSCHFFAGIGGWPLALQLAGWPDHEPVWTGSCPCQPFSVAGRRRAKSDDRHLWPAWFRLIQECRPATIFGEQVASVDGREWLAGVRNDMESLGYAFGAADLCAAGVGAPHLRQRLYWLAHAGRDGSQGRLSRRPDQGRETQSGSLGHRRTTGGLAAAPGLRRSEGRTGTKAGQAVWGGDAGGLADPDRRLDQGRGPGSGEANGGGTHDQLAGPGAAGGAWDQFDLIPCRDGKVRRVEPGTFPLAHGIPRRVVKLRGYGNAIVPALAAVFIRAFLEAR